MIVIEELQAFATIPNHSISKYMHVYETQENREVISTKSPKNTLTTFKNALLQDKFKASRLTSRVNRLS